MMQTSSDAQRGTYQIDFESLIKVLGENLYSNPKAVVRELIQNANDSCVRRRAKEDTFSQPTIAVSVDRNKRVMVVEDNGSGMVQEEVKRYLASIGGGLTREERKRMMTSDQENAKMLIGQFGIGFLSSFVVAHRVTVETCSLSRQEPVYWECEGTSEYTIGLGKRTEPGTKVTLYLKPAHYDLLEDDTIKEAIIRYADFIAIPIYLNRGRTPVNRMNAPWHTDGSESEYAEYIKHRYGVDPLALNIISADHSDLQVQGVIFILPRIVKSERRLGAVDLFQKRMYVREDTNLLPEWAGFVSAILDSPSLELVASREAVQTERPSYTTLQEYLTEAVTDFVRQLAERERPTFLEVIRQYDWTVMAGAIRNDFFFDRVKDLIPFPSDSGKLTIPKYLERVPPRLGNLKTIYYVPGEQPLGQQQSSLFKARGVPIYQADIIAEEFLHKYAERTENITLRPMLSGIVELMEPAEELRWRALEALYQELGVAAKAVKFYPSDMAAMAVRQNDYDQEQLIKQVVDGSRAVMDFMDRVGKEKSDAYGLCFNVDNPMIKKLAEYAGDKTVLETALRSIYASALVAAGVELTPELSQKIAVAQMRMIELLLEQAERIESGQIIGPYAPSQFEDIGPFMAQTMPETEIDESLYTFVNDFTRDDRERSERPESFLKRILRRFGK